MWSYKENGIKHTNEEYLISCVHRIIVIAFLLLVGNHRGVLCRSRTPRPNLPSFRNTPSNFTYPQGELAVLYCSVENLGTRAVIWRKASQPNPLTIGELTYVADDRFKLHHIPDKGEWNLFIKNIQHKDAGMYECQISTKEKYIRKLIQVNVIDRQFGRRAIQIVGPHQVEKGGTMVLFCNATGGSSAPHDLDWLKNNRKLVTEKSGRINITKHISFVTMTITSNLTVRQVLPTDDGTYVCRTSDEMVRNISVKVTGGGSEKPKRTILQHKPSTSSAASSQYLFLPCVCTLFAHINLCIKNWYCHLILAIPICFAVVITVL